MPTKLYLKINHLIVTFSECLISLITYKSEMKDIKKLVKLI